MHEIECALIATVGGEVKTGTSAAGKSWMSFSGRVGSGEEAQWPRISAFGDVAKTLEGRLGKGTRVYVEGTIRLNSWQSAGGEPRSGLGIAARRCDIIGAIGRQRPQEAATAAKAAAPAQEAPFDDAVPF